MGDILKHARALERDTREEAQGTDGLHDGGPGPLLLLEQKELRGAAMLRTQGLRGGVKVPREISDTAERAVYGAGG